MPQFLKIVKKTNKQQNGKTEKISSHPGNRDQDERAEGGRDNHPDPTHQRPRNLMNLSLLGRFIGQADGHGDTGQFREHKHRAKKCHQKNKDNS